MTQQAKQKIISETVAALAMHGTITKAAIALKVERSTIYRRMDDFPEIREAVEKVKQEALLTLMNNTGKAAEIMVEGMDDKRQKYDSAKYILDGMGVTKQKDTNVQVNVLNQIKSDKKEFEI